MTDDLRRGADETAGRDTLDLNGIVCNQAVASLDKLDGGFTFTDTAVTENQNALAVNINEDTVARDARCQMRVERCDERGHGGAGGLRGGKHGNAALFCVFDENFIGHEVGRVENCDGFGIYKTLQNHAARAFFQRFKILRFHASHQLNTVGLEELVKACKGKTRTVDLG